MKYYYYKIESLINGHLYIGITINPKRRRKAHFTELRCNCHDNSYLQAAFKKYGEENFIFSIIEELEAGEKEAYEHEAELINKYDSYKNGYNLKPGGLYNAGGNRKFTDKQIYQILAALDNSNRCKAIIAECMRCGPHAIGNISSGETYTEYYNHYQSFTIEEKNNYYEDFCSWSNFALLKYTSCTNSYRKYYKDQIFLVLLADKTRFMAFCRVALILNTKSTGLVNIRKGISYKDYYQEFQTLSKEELDKLQSLYTERYTR